MNRFVYEEIFEDGNAAFGFYDRFYQNIKEEMTILGLPGPALVSWLKKEERQEAMKEFALIPKISSIEDQFQTFEAKYPDVDFEYFNPK